MSARHIRRKLVKKIMLWCLSIASGVASENSAEIEQSQVGAYMAHQSQVVEKEIRDYTHLLEGVQQDNSPLGIMLKTHYTGYLAKLQKLLESDDTGKSIEGQLYQLHQTDSLFSRYY